MENREYNILVINKEFDKLANITKMNDLVEYKYLNLYLIEYLLQQNIHTRIMDSHTQHSAKWIKFYLKYNITKPLLQVFLKPLMETKNGVLLFDELLDKLNDDEKMELLNNLKSNSYWELHNHEEEVIDLYAKHGISIPQIFVKRPSILDSKVTLAKKDKDLIDEFCYVYKDTDKHTLNIYLHELKRRLGIDNKRAKDDIRKLIDYKKKNKEFSLQLSHDTEGVYDGERSKITISPSRQGVFTHELSHLMYDQYDEQADLKKYERLRKKVNNKKTIANITNYLKDFHKRFFNMQDYFSQIYYRDIKRKYKTYNEYIKAVCTDIYQNRPDIIAVNDDTLYFYIDDDNIEEVATELLIIEKNEFVNMNTRNYYNEELMLENLLDALLKGSICDGKLGIDCLSGHIGRDFEEDDELSFDEALADYDAIKNSKKSAKLINDLSMLVGNELIEFLEEHLEKNRSMKHGI